MSRYSLSFFLLLFIVSLAGAGSSAAAAEVLAPSELTIAVRSGASHRFEVEVADTPQARTVGLMYRRQMDLDSGMLFDLKRPTVISMWMKDTFLPLDMIFADERGVIVYIVERTTPHSLKPLGPLTPVLGVLEVNAGTVERLGIQRGDRLIHRVFVK